MSITRRSEQCRLSDAIPLLRFLPKDLALKTYQGSNIDAITQNAMKLSTGLENNQLIFLN